MCTLTFIQGVRKLCVLLYITTFLKNDKKCSGADSLVGSVPTHSAVVLLASRVRVPACGHFPIQVPYN